MMRHFLLRWELPAIFACALAAALMAATEPPDFLRPALSLAARPYVVAFFLLVALWCVLFWLLLLPHKPRQATHQLDKRHDDQHDGQHRQSGRTPRPAA